MSDESREMGPCGKHPRKIAETPGQAWYRAYDSPNADKDPSQHCPECDRAAAVEREGAPAPFTFTLEEIMTALDVASEGRPNWQGIKPDLLGNQLVRVMRRKLERTAQSPVAPAEGQ